MTGKSDTGSAAEANGSAEAPDSAAAEKDETKAARPRRIVRSRSTAVAGEGESAKADEGASEGAKAEGDAAPAAAPGEGAAPEVKAEASRPRHDMRAPARPAGAPRPRPEGMPQRPPRPGAIPERSFDPDRPRPPRGERPPRGDRPPRRDGGPRGDRPRTEGRPSQPGEGAPRAEAKSVAGGAAAAPRPAAQKPAAPAQKPAAPAQKPAAPQKPATPAPLTSAPKGNKPVFVPLLRAGQAPASAKPVALTAKEALAAKAKAHAPKAPAKSEEKVEAAAAKQDFSADALAAGWESARSFVNQAGEAGAALVEAWLTGSNAAAIAAIADAGDVASAPRKAARRALAVLKARGVTIPERPKSTKVEERADSLEATMIPCDSFGTWSVAITSRDASGRYRIAEVIGREPAGVIQAAGGWLSGSQLKEGRARAQNNVGMAPVPVPLGWARARVKAALALNAKSGQVVPLGYEACRELFEVATDAAPEHPIAELIGKSVEDAEARVKASGSLHEEPEFGGWLPDRRALDEMMQNVGNRLGPQGTQDPAAVNAALTEEADAATDRYFTPEVREQLAARMRDSAISVRSRRGDDRALDVIATARAVKEAGLITSPPREIPFLVAFFQKGLSALAQAGGGRLRVPVRGPAPAPAEPAAEAAPAPTPSEGA